MTYLLATYWLPLLLALAVGLLTGWFTYDRSKGGFWPERWPGWLKLLGLAFVIGVVIAWGTWFPRTSGFWLETALLFVAAWFIGCLLGNWLASFTVAAPAEAQTPAAAPAVTPAPAPVAPPVVPVAAPVAAPVVTAAVEPEPVAAPAVIAAQPEPAPLPEPEPDFVPAVVAASSEVHPGDRPLGYAAPATTPDDLQRIKGIGPKNEALLHELGIYYFRQIAGWNDSNIAWVNSYLKFKGRIEREEWVAQAVEFAAGRNPHAE